MYLYRFRFRLVSVLIPGKWEIEFRSWQASPGDERDISCQSIRQSDTLFFKVKFLATFYGIVIFLKERFSWEEDFIKRIMATWLRGYQSKPAVGFTAFWLLPPKVWCADFIDNKISIRPQLMGKLYNPVSNPNCVDGLAKCTAVAVRIASLRLLNINRKWILRNITHNRLGRGSPRLVFLCTDTRANKKCHDRLAASPCILFFQYFDVAESNVVQARCVYLFRHGLTTLATA